MKDAEKLLPEHVTIHNCDYPLTRKECIKFVRDIQRDARGENARQFEIQDILDILDDCEQVSVITHDQNLNMRGMILKKLIEISQ